MYSLVLAAMLTTGTATAPTWHYSHGCHGCCGGYSSCHGCCGYSSCHGCCGYSSCHGCCGYTYGCSGCWGSSAGIGCYGGYGCYGAHPYYGCNGCFGVFGCGGGYSGVVASYSGSAPYAGGIVSAPLDRSEGLAGAVPQPSVLAQMQAEAPAVATRVTVKLPADAKLYVNNDPCPLTSTTRSFETPKLNADQDYTYTIKVQVTRNGQTFSESKKVVFKAGDPVSVNFNDVGTVRTAQK